MEFGRLPESQLNTIDFTLPKEPSFNKHILPGKIQHRQKFMLVVPSGEEKNG